jgi:hypothetical protein
MDWSEVAQNVLLSSLAIKGYAVAGSILAAYIFNNYIDKPIAKQVAYEVAKAVEDEAEEGTTLDTFLDEFIKRFENKKGRKPTASELKTGMDFKDKTDFNFEISRKF